MKLILKITTLLLFTLNLHAQEYKNYQWEKTEAYKPTDKEKNQEEIILLNKTIKEFIIENGKGYDYTITHTKTFVNSDHAIENNNKIYVHLKNDTDEVITQKVRVIKPNNTVIELDNSDIKEAVNEQNNSKYNYFAVRGLEKKCTIEQLTITKTTPKVDGKTIVLQNDILQKNISYNIIYPNHLIFNFKSYNNLPNFKIEENKETKKTTASLNINQIEALRQEKYSNYNANTQKFTYKLSGNKLTNKFDLNNYKDYVNEITTFATKKLESKENTALQKLIKNIKKENNTQKQITTIENYLKTNIAHNEEAHNIDYTINTTITNKFTNTYGLLRLYKNVFDAFNIKTDIVITSNRYKENIDPDFESYGALDQFTLFIPEQNGYIAPTEITARFPILPYIWTNCNALFTKTITFSGKNVTDFEIKKIQTPSTDYTHDEMDININFEQNPTKPIINATLQFNGYTAQNFQPYYDFIDKDKIEELEKDIAQNYSTNNENITVTSQNKGLENTGKPYILNIQYTGENLVEKAANKILFKVGEVIGKQAELYQKEKRQTNIDIQYPHAYHRTITITLPKDYKITNPEQLKSSFTTTDNNNEVCKFSTQYNLNKNQLTITNIEFYKTSNLPKTLYDNYIKVLNAAADFNKLVLVLQKQ